MHDVRVERNLAFLARRESYMDTRKYRRIEGGQFTQASLEKIPVHIGVTSEIARTLFELKVPDSNPDSHRNNDSKSSWDKGVAKVVGDPYMATDVETKFGDSRECILWRLSGWGSNTRG